MEYFKKLLDLLKIEREEDHNQYRKLTEQSSVAERRANGLTWYPVAIRGSEMSRGDYLTVELERTTHQDIAHQFRFGMPAVFFCNHDAKNDRVEGTITHQNGNRLKITLRTDELPEWSRDGKLGIDVLFDDNSYEEMQSALKQAMAVLEKSTNEPATRLAAILTGEKKPTFKEQAPFYSTPSLNPSQQSAVDSILRANELAVVHGPPGTGKTTTLVQAIKALVKTENQKVLVVAPSNTAVDLLSEKLHEEGLNVLRVGNPARVTERLTALTLDSKMAEHPYMKEAKRLKKQAQELKAMAHKYKRSFGKSERDQRKLLFVEAHRIMKEVGNTEQYIIDDLLVKAQVVTATLVGSNHYTVREVRYHTVVIDEAGQALEPACWIPVLKAQKVILAGDHCQLSPTIKSEVAAKGGLSTTLLEKCVDAHPEAVTLLEEQYRMNEQIMGYSSQIFYQHKLKAHASVAHRVLFTDDKPVLFIDTAGCGFEEKLEGTSSTNPEEAALLLKHLGLLTAEWEAQKTDTSFPSIAIIAPYKQQIHVLAEQLSHVPELQPYLAHMAVNTVDSFQGQERDVVYISMTRSNSEGSIGFLADIRRMNVAMTRARKKLVVVGDSATLAQFPFYADFISYAERLDAYLSAWELI
ncbi:AAA domain-containing protein [Runella slithyformis]|uniref:Type III restriction protein res subunit n=1 Tax=Runella slithyformis (strain ATCC 29530 / DSM 19594 / LMG 11500 / NCIMB 11436 / LSU 4) TaxID=761193 RepID=A0A7U4E4S7_RUNSL|nr:AAA domain-containing protein [Runella slithyformis]AEI47748.1 type III restriction protein res subunit [Runella slithyformis DSM 19594]